MRLALNSEGAANFGGTEGLAGLVSARFIAEVEELGAYFERPEVMQLV